MIKIFNWFKRFWCEHEYEFVRNIYGDEINECGGYRSLWKCNKCGRYKYDKMLFVKKPLKETLNGLYDDYYDNEYDNWCKEHEEFLQEVTNKLVGIASLGLCYAEVIMTTKESTNDRWHFEQWLQENRLKYEHYLYNQKERFDEINQYIFKIRWK